MSICFHILAQKNNKLRMRDLCQIIKDDSYSLLRNDLIVLIKKLQETKFETSTSTTTSK